MKRFKYIWDESIYLLHTEYNIKETGVSVPYLVSIHRNASDGKILLEEKKSIFDPSFRTIVSRTSVEESIVEIFYPDEVVLTVYRIDDRAYYPTQSLYEG